MIKAVVFDLDGVLVDATEWHYEALNRALRLFGFGIDRAEHLAQYNGLPTRVKLEMLSKQRGFPVALHPFVCEQKQIYTKELIATRCREDFEKIYMLKELRARGYRLAVASNAVRATCELMLQCAGLMRHLEFFLSNEDTVRHKPDPEVYLKAFAVLGVDGSEVLVVEDAPHGVAAARVSGAHVLAVGGYGDVHIDAVLRRIAGCEQE